MSDRGKHRNGNTGKQQPSCRLPDKACFYSSSRVCVFRSALMLRLVLLRADSTISGFFRAWMGGYSGGWRVGVQVSVNDHSRNTAHLGAIYSPCPDPVLRSAAGLRREGDSTRGEPQECPLGPPPLPSGSGRGERLLEHGLLGNLPAFMNIIRNCLLCRLSSQPPFVRIIV